VGGEHGGGGELLRREEVRLPHGVELSGALLVLTRGV
jgi:hypothetical protein